jgi:hypothetical protein
MKSKNDKNRPLKDLHDEEVVRVAETGNKAQLQMAVDEAVARDDERNRQ